MLRPLEVLYEDNHLLAVAKPAGLPTMGVPEGKPSLLAVAKDYIKRKYDKPGNVYLGVVSRLDAPVTGVVMIARTSKAAARLTAQFRGGDVEKIYWAIVAGAAKQAEVECLDWLRKDERHRKMHLGQPHAEGAKEARLTYRLLTPIGGNSLVEVKLHTGRKHQIRVQLSSRRHAILGDRKYGSRDSFSDGIALHARRLALTHPVRKTPLEIVAPLPDAWQAAGVSQRMIRRLASSDRENLEKT